MSNEIAIIEQQTLKEINEVVQQLRFCFLNMFNCIQSNNPRCLLLYIFCKYQWTTYLCLQYVTMSQFPASCKLIASLYSGSSGFWFIPAGHKPYNQTSCRQSLTVKYTSYLLNIFKN